MMSRRFLIALASAIAVWASGCMGLADGDTFEIGPLRIGDEFLYAGSDGTHVTVVVEGLSTARDRYLREHASVRLNFTIQRTVNAETTGYVTEDIALDTGKTVRQVWRCTFPSPTVVADCEHKARIWYGASGLPGGLGAGPFWGPSGIDRGGSTLAVATPMPRIEALQYHISPADDDCIVLTYSTTGETPRVHGLWAATSVLYEPLTVCQGIPLPVQWRPTMAMQQGYSTEPRPVFKLVDWQRGNGEPVRMGGADRAQAATAPPVALRSWNETPFLVPDDSAYTPLSSPEAYEQARVLDEQFARMIDRGAIVVSNVWQPGERSGCCLVPVREATGYIRDLVVQAPSGDAYGVRIQRTDSWTRINGSEPPAYELLGFWTEARVPVDSSIPQNRSADPADGLEFAVGLGLDSMMGTRYSFLTDDLALGNRTNRSDGFGISLQFAPGLDDGGVAVGYTVKIDGPTGSLLIVDVGAHALESFP